MRLRFSKQVGENAYLVTAETDAGVVALGRVVRDRRSTDSTVGGRGGRLRRPGKGADVWIAEVPRERWTHPRHSRTGDRLKHLPKTAGQLQGEYGGGFRLEQFGEKWDRRHEAAQALVEFAGIEG